MYYKRNKSPIPILPNLALDLKDALKNGAKKTHYLPHVSYCLVQVQLGGSASLNFSEVPTTCALGSSQAVSGTLRYL